MMKGTSNVTIEKFIKESKDDDLKKNFVGVFSANQIFRFINFHSLINDKNA